jgi:hypothetical protein
MGIMRDHVLDNVKTRFNYLIDPLSDKARDALLATMSHPTLRKFIISDIVIKHMAQDIFLDKLVEFVNEDHNYVYKSTAAQHSIETPLLKFLDLPSTSQTDISYDSVQKEGRDFLSDISDCSISLLNNIQPLRRCSCATT